MKSTKGAYFSKKRSKALKRTFRRHGILITNATLIVALTGFVWVGHNSASSDTKSFSLINQSNNQIEAAPLDTLSSADIAANIALAVSMPEEVMVVNQADSYKAQLAKTTTEEAVVTKPQIVTGSAASISDVQDYTAQLGDTATSVAEKFGVSADTIKWSNDLSVDTIPAGKKLRIPPENGVLYNVGNNDTVNSIASTYSANEAKIIAFNDIEITGLKKGDTIFIPGGQKPAEPVYSAPASSGGSSLGTYGFVARYGGNGYTYGYCTWYAASRVSVPNNWGNANTWDNYARSSGWTVSSRPVAGAIAQTDAMSWWGHVAVVEEVSADGSQIRYSDMNGLAGWNRVGTSGWVSSSTFQNYIYN